MDYRIKKEWLKAILYAFSGGFIIIAPLDLLHTYTGVQIYLLDRFLIDALRWPFYIPLQMGIIAIIVLINWTLFRQYLVDKVIDAGIVQNRLNYLTVMSIFFVISGYVLAVFTEKNPHRIEIFLSIYLISFIYIILFQSKHHVLAYLIIGPCGVAAEWILLFPGFNYYEFVQKDILNRVPIWLPFVYGWVGIYIHEISKSIPRKRY